MLDINTGFQKGERVFPAAAQKCLLDSQLVSEEMRDSSLTWGCLDLKERGCRFQQINQTLRKKLIHSFQTEV